MTASVNLIKNPLQVECVKPDCRTGPLVKTTHSCVTFSLSAFLSLNLRMSWKLCIYLGMENIHKRVCKQKTHRKILIKTKAHQLWTKLTDEVLSRLSGSKLISFMMFASLTGSSCLRKAKDVFSHAFSEPEGRQKHGGLSKIL